MKKRVDILKKVVWEAGEAIQKVGLNVVEKTKKDDLDLVTQGDYESERIIVGAVNKHFPEDKILSEETEPDKGLKGFDGFVWVIDPIDGTINYSRKRHYSCVSVAVTWKKEVLAGVVYSPFLGDFYFSEKGKGAFLNGKKIGCSEVEDPRKALMVTDNSVKISKFKKQIEMLMKFEGAKYFINGSGALNFCEAAGGKTDLYVHAASHPWDNAAGYIVAKEAGCRITDLSGKDVDFYSPEIVVANPRLLGRFIKESTASN